MSLIINGVGQSSFTMNNISIENLYVDNVLVWTIDSDQLSPPIYQMSEDLILNEGFNFIEDSSNETSNYDGKLTESDGTTPYLPTVAEYPQDGTIDLSEEKILDTRYVPKVNDGIYWLQHVDKGISYNIYALHIKANNLVDVYVGNQDTPIVLTESDKPYTLPTESWKILETIPDIVLPISSPELVPNPNFDTDIAGVTEPGSAIASWQAPGYWRTTTSGGERETHYILTDVLEIGVEYIADAVYGDSNMPYGSLQIRNVSDDSDIGEKIINESAYVGPTIFTATETSLYWRSRSGPDSGWIDIDSITLKRNV